ncbi:Flp pilus assembly protein CpaB [Paraburkholderia phytofirmans]|uniref:Flp pilus assembly protein CpaB n=1 Tax=Paraburkholderia phytofirmans OLGA172 TaxID=1417228 RepID=A0A160FJC3_9BURK|nr:Flp pilus assembly protein CpaB [Paraburkholderia phytofirmans]ANB72335.1 Flp pilus assembly protein CpaB [Paraburkholderia phytofirmans OLGA172]
MPTLTKILAGVLIAVALLLGLFAWTLSRRPAPVAVTAATHASFPVVVATRMLPAGKPITVDELRVQTLPINPNGAFTDPAQLAGRVPNAEIGADSPVLEAQLSSGLAERIEPGERALAVRVDEGNAVGNRLRPGNFVDVFFTLKRDGVVGNGSEIDRTQARLLMSKVRVLAFGNATTNGDSAGDPNGMVRTAVLAVPVADVDRLTLAESAGRLIFALRNPKDAEVVDQDALPSYPGVLKTVAHTGAAEPLQDSTRAAAGVSLDALSGSTSSAGAGARPPLPHMPPPPTRVAGNTNSTKSGIEVIRGGRAESVAW